MIIFASGCSYNDEINYPKGGYDYPGEIGVNDSNDYYCPLRRVLSKKDSFYFSRSYQFLRAIEEENLSLKPMQKDIFRFVYEQWKGPTIIITLNSKEITIKKGRPYDLYEHDEDQSRLSAIEKEHLKLLTIYYPIDTNSKNIRVNHILDSFVQQYPELLDPNYYRYLLDKKLLPSITKFTYSTKKIIISQKTHFKLVNQINASGYWQLPYIINCETFSTDGARFELEANTKRKYNFVSKPICPNDTTLFAKACFELVKHAGMDKEINLFWDGKVDTARKKPANIGL